MEYRSCDWWIFFGFRLSRCGTVNLWCAGQTIKDIRDFRRMWEFYENKAAGVDEVTKTNMPLQKMDYLQIFVNKMDELHALAPADPKRCQRTLHDFITYAAALLHNVEIKR